MSNDKILKCIQELLKKECFRDSIAFQKLIKQTEKVPSIFAQAITDSYNSLIDVLAGIIENSIEQFRSVIDEILEQVSKSTSQVRHQVGYSKLYRKKIKLQILKPKRLWKRQKIP